MRANGQATIDMAMGGKLGQMGPITTEIGKTIK